MSLSCSLSHRTELSNAQQRALKELYEIRLNLIDKSLVPNAMRGLEGMEIAHHALIEKGAVGLLVGGVLDSVWQNHGIAALAKHKDVDVLVATRSFTPPEPFWRGIDWWTPQSANLEIRGDASTFNKYYVWYQNGNEIPLTFGAMLPRDMQPGLYIPDEKFLLEMRVHEAVSTIDPHAVSVDDDVIDAFESKLSQQFNDRCNSAVKQMFGKNVLEYVARTSAGRPDKSSLRPNHIVLDNFSRDEISAIRKYLLDPQKPAFDELSLPKASGF